jgi:hypothetical protein
MPWRGEEFQSGRTLRESTKGDVGTSVFCPPVTFTTSKSFRFTWCVTMGEVNQPPPHRTITRRSDEPQLEIGDKIPMGEGVVGVVLACYTRSSDARNEVYYVVELRREAEEH